VLRELCAGSVSRSKSVCRLLEEGNSIPFIARYRRADTGNMMPDELREFQERLGELK
jgi:transcriptional accessory protein Tex/SPT6